MKKLLLCAGLFSLAFSLTQCNRTDSVSHTPRVKSYDKKTRADLAAEQNFLMTRDPKTNSVPRKELWKAIDELKRQERFKNKAVISSLSWTERGPNNVGGRTRAIMMDPNDADGTRAFAGGVSGGIWVTENIFASSPEWTEIDPFLDNMAVTSLAYDPSKPDTMYMGTGEGFYNADAVVGDGIWRSTDGGANWTQLANTTSYSYIQKIVVDSIGNIYAATRNYGLVKSTNSGNTWSAVLNSSGTPSTNRVADVEIARNGDIYAAFGIFSTDGVYKSTNGGSSWSKVYTSSGEQRLELACAPSNSDVIYMVTQSSSTYNANAVRRSTNGGSSWSSLTNPSDAVGGSNFCRGQAWYDISLVVDPNDDDVAYMGGIDLYKTTDGGSNWTQVSHWYGGGGYPEVHADQHLALYYPNSSDTILFGNDGGVYISENATSSTPSFEHQVSTYNVTQFYGGAVHPSSGTDYFLAGAQDNGSHQFSEMGMNNTTEVTGGDGAFCHIDQDDPTYQFTQYVYNQFRRSTDGGNSFTSINFSSSAGKFINPTDYDNDAFIMYSSWGNGTYMRWTNPRTGTTASTVSFGGSGEPSAIMCDPNTSNRIYIGTDAGEIYQIDNANGSISATDITETGMSGYVSSIDVEQGDANHLLATFSNYGVTSVWESTDGGSSWNSVEGNLPNIPVRWGLFSPIGGDSAFLATELGVWTTDNLNGGSTVWGSSNTGLANVRTDMLQWRESDSTIIAITHGRGLFSLSLSEVVNPDFSSMNTAVYPCETVNFSDGSTGASSWAWDFNNDGITDATTQNPSWTYKTGGYKDVKLVINGTDSIIKSSYITVLPKLGTPYTTSDGGDFESNTWHFASKSILGTNIWERGSPSNQLTTLNTTSNGWKTDLDADCPDETTEAHLYTPSFNLSASGTYTLAFRKSMEQWFSNAPYAVVVEYSDNGGISWTKLGTSPDANGTNWYANTGLDASIAADGIGFLENATNENTSYDISSLAGKSDVRFRFVYRSNGGFSTTGFRDGFMIDDFTISGPANDPYYPVETDLNASATEYLGPNDSVTFISDNCKIIATLVNLSTHDYGPTTVTIDNAGTATMDFSTNTAAAAEIMEKTIYISPTTNNSSGSVRIKTYYTDTEAGNWKTATGWNYNDLNQIKSSSAITSASIAGTVHGTNPDIDSTYLGDDVMISCTYSNGFSGVGAGKNGASGPLPVELLSFEGEMGTSGVTLKWTTASEINSDRFEIERKISGGFVNIADTPSAGNSWSILKYSYLDSDPAIKSAHLIYYRLKMIDLDGSYEYSKTIKVENRNISVLTALLPNPAVDHIELRLDNESKRSIEFEIIDINGRSKLNGSLNANTSVVDVRALSNGMYFILLKKDGVILEQRKFVISR